MCRDVSNEYPQYFHGEIRKKSENVYYLLVENASYLCELTDGCRMTCYLRKKAFLRYALLGSLHESTD